MKRTQLPRIIILHIIFGTVSAPFGQHRRPKLASGFASWHGGFPHTVGGNRRSNGPKIAQHTLHLASSAVSQHQLAAHALLWYHHQEPAESDSDGVDYERERERERLAALLSVSCDRDILPSTSTTSLIKDEGSRFLGRNMHI